ncbi:alpha/beta-type small acid-soluble spore protein [Vallitalea okinawensis]|uniref:alpha/beta-type small acid-soluble spore protein n=1 Tax=Vallitalea okinawensis TaxID=2078660 RepID=UPI000CFE2ABE|nr:alpha/beta-type small acid-soluble spore protein [Vallitalea okinawensis]
MSKRPLIPNAEGALAKFKMEIANELGIANTQEMSNITDEPQHVNQQVQSGGNIGGQMVKRMIERVEREMAQGNRIE